MLTTPLQILVFSAPDCDSAAPFLDAIVTAFQGGGTGYIAGADDTGVPVWEYTGTPQMSVQDALRGALHTVAVVLLTGKMLEDQNGLIDWLKDLAERAKDPGNAILVIDLDQSGRTFIRKAAVKPSQIFTPEALGEYAVRPAVAGLIALRNAIEVVSSGSTKLESKLKLFVSHAKLDGISLAKSLSDLITSLPRFKSFYDAKDIAPESDFRQVLQEGVENSVLIILRSGQFEDRPWCLQEMQWAEEYTSPYMVVDLRHALIVPPAKAVFENVPTVWVPDGNQYRIVFIALRESLRCRLHVRIAEALEDMHPQGRRYEILIRRPSMRGLRRLLGPSGPKAPVTIVYPDPPLPAADNDAAQTYVRALSVGSVLTTPQSIAATALAGGAP